MKYRKPQSLDWFMDAQWDYVESNAARIHFVDIETTGTEAGRHEILTLSCGTFEWPSLKPVAEIEIRMKPDHYKYWDREAEEIHKIPREKTVLFDRKKAAWPMFLSYLEDNSIKSKWSLFACHALNMGDGYFDWKMISMELEMRGLRYRLERLIPGVGIRSTVDYYRMAANRNFVPPAPVEPDKNGKLRTTYKLKALCAMLGIQLDHHEARSDRVASYKLFKFIHEINEEAQVVMKTEIEATTEGGLDGV